MTRYVGVDDQKAAGFPVTVACEAVEVSTSGFYDWAARHAAVCIYNGVTVYLQ